MREFNLGKSRRATMLMFMFSGVGISSWAPMIPYAKTRLALNDAHLGLVIFALGIGATATMPFSGLLINRIGTQRIMVVCSTVVVCILPLLSFVTNPWLLALLLFLFGGANGVMGVARNNQAVAVESRLGRPAMSSFHGMYSVGCLVGSLSMAALLKTGLDVRFSALVMAAALALLAISQCPSLLPHSADLISRGAKMTRPGRIVIFLGLLCFITYLAEGTVLDWGAVYLHFSRGYSVAQAGIGFSAFAVAMTIGRLSGDAITRRLGPARILLFGGFFASAGYLVVVFVPWSFAPLVGFVMVGAALSNVVPVLISTSGRLPDLAPSVAIPMVTTIACAGLLLGPAVIGFIANAFTLATAFVGIAGLLVVLGCSSRVTRAATRQAPDPVV